MSKDITPGAVASVRAVARQQAYDNRPLPSTIEGAGSAHPEPLAKYGPYQLLSWERCNPSGTGPEGIATVLLPSGKLGLFGVYNLTKPVAEWGPTALRRHLGRRDCKELTAAAPVVVELVRLHDPEALAPHGLFASPSGASEAKR